MRHSSIGRREHGGAQVPAAHDIILRKRMLTVPWGLVNAASAALFLDIGAFLSACVLALTGAHPLAAAEVEPVPELTRPVIVWPKTAGPGIKPPPFIDWTGTYAGPNIGFGSGHLIGGLFGITVGSNLQMGSTVFGIETDLDGSTLGGNAVCSSGGICDFQSRWIGTARGRVGYAIDRWLPFVTLGVAVSEIKANSVGFGTTSAWKIGTSVGGGIEFDLGRGFSARVDYLHNDFGNFSCGAACGGVGRPTEFRFQNDVFRFGLTYRFWPETVLSGPPIKPPPF